MDKLSLEYDKKLPESVPAIILQPLLLVAVELQRTSDKSEIPVGNGKRKLVIY